MGQTNKPEIAAESVAPEGSSKPLVPDHELLKLIGRGAYGEVWLARNIMGEYRAVKVVYRRSFDHERPYQREFEGIKKFEPVSRSHESQVDILHVGRNEEGGYFYYVMELADDQMSGQKIDPSTYRPSTLKSRLQNEGRLPVADCVRLGLSLTTALTHLHRYDLVHRDIKPSNIIFVNDIPKLADIGLVSSFDATRSYVGTLGFAPPEGSGTVSADLYSLGKVLYEAATGRDRQDFPELPSRLDGTEEQQGALVELNEIILRACDTDIHNRYQSAEAMHAELVLLESGKSVARLHAAERTLARLKRIGALGVTVTLLVIAAFIYQAHETKLVRNLATRNSQLAEESKSQLRSLQLANVVRKMEEGDLAASLPWLAEALHNSKGDYQKETAQRRLLGSVLEQCPKPIHLFLLDSPAYACLFSPDGHRLILGQGVKTSEIDVATGHPLFALSLSNSWNRWAEFSPDGRRLILRWDSEIKIYDSANGQALDFPQEPLRLKTKICSKDGKTVLVRENETSARVYDLDSGRTISRSFGTEGNLIAGYFGTDTNHVLLRFHNDATKTNQAGQVCFQVWDLKTGKSCGPSVAVDRYDYAQVFRGGTRLGIVEDSGLHVYDTSTGSELERKEDWDKVDQLWELWAVAPVPGGTRFWNLDTEQPLFLRFPGPIRDVALSPDGLLLATSSDDGTVRIWNAATGEPMCSPLRHARWAFGVRFSPDSHLLATCSEDRTLRVWDLASVVQPVCTLRDHDTINSAAFSPDGEKIVTSGLSVSVWDARTFKPIGLRSYGPYQLTDLRFSADGTRFVTFEKLHTGWLLSDAFLWDGSSDQKRPAFFDLASDEVVVDASFSPDGQRVVTAGYQSKEARIWSTRTGGKILAMPHGSRVTGARFSPDGGLVATVGGALKLWDAEKGVLLRAITNSTVTLDSVAFSPDGENLATGSSDQAVRVWNTRTLTPVTPPLFHGGTVLFTKFSPDGKLLMSWGPADDVKIWDIQLGKLYLAPLKNTSGITDADFSRDGRLCITCGTDGITRVWDATTGQPVTAPIKSAHAAHDGRYESVYSAVFSPSGAQILTAGGDTFARVWNLPTCQYEEQEIGEFAQLLSAYSVDRTGVLTQLSGTEVRDRFEKLVKRRPEAFQESNPQRVAAWHEQMSEEAARAGSWSSVIWNIDQALRLDPGIEQTPSFDEVFRRRGEAQAELGHWTEAVADFERGIRASPGQFFHRYCLLYALVAAGATERFKEESTTALDCFEWVSDLCPAEPYSGGVKASLARACALAPNEASNAGRALRIFERFKTGGPHVCRLWQSLLLSRSGHQMEALKLLQENLTVGPKQISDAPPVYEQLVIEAVVYARANQADKARELLTAAAKAWETEKQKPFYSKGSGPKSDWTDRVAYMCLRNEAEAVSKLMKNNDLTQQSNPGVFPQLGSKEAQQP